MNSGYCIAMVTVFCCSFIMAAEDMSHEKRWIVYTGRNQYISDMWIQADAVKGNVDINVGCSGKTMIKIEDMSNYAGTLIVSRHGADLFTHTELTQFRCKLKLYGDFSIYSYDGTVLKREYSNVAKSLPIFS